MAELLDDNLRRARAAGLRASHAVATGDYRAATTAAERAAACAGAAGEPGAALSAIINRARALHFQGDPSAQQQEGRRCHSHAKSATGRSRPWP